MIGSTTLILLPIWGGDTFAWSSPTIIVTAAIALVATIAFIAQEQRAAEPVLPMRLFADRTPAAIFAMGFLLMGSLLAVMTFLPLFLQVSTGVSATRSGLMLIPQSLGITVAATASGWLVTRTGRYKWALVSGPLVGALALLALTTIDPDTGFAQIGPVLLVLGFGLGLTFPNLTLTIQNAAPIADLGVATSASNFFRSMGGAFGAAVGGAIVGARLDAELLERLGQAEFDQVGGAEGLIRSPEKVRQLPDELRTAAAGAVADSVVSMVWRTLPAMVLIAVLALVVRETALRTTSGVGGDDTTSGDDT